MDYKIVIFDDNADRRDSLQFLLYTQNDMHCVGAFEDGRDALHRIESARPNLVLMDIDMPFVNGIEAVQLIRKSYPNLKIIMQTVFEDDDKVFNAICAGADGYLLKQISPEKLIAGIREVMEGGAPITPIIAKKLLAMVNSGTRLFPKHNFELTKREIEILELLAKGYSYKMIAAECFISYTTVNSHVTNIYRKLQVESVGGAVAKAIREGLIKTKNL